MRHFPVFVALDGRRVLVSGAGEAAVAKLKLILKTNATVEVFGSTPHADVQTWAQRGKLVYHDRPMTPTDVTGATLVYAANEDARLDAEVARMGQDAGVLSNIVDNLDDSAFITPAMVDRSPVTVAIGTEGTAPVLARKIKSDIEAMLPQSLGLLAQAAARFRTKAEALPMGRKRRGFWSRFFFKDGPVALAKGGVPAVDAVLHDILADELGQPAGQGRVALVGAGPGDPDLLTRRALKLLHEADVVIHDRLVSAQIMELVRREAIVVAAGKTGFGPSWGQDDINAEMIRHARDGHLVVRLKGGDPVIFGRLDEETASLDAAGIPFEVVPGVTAASAAAAGLGVSLTARGRNSSLRVLTAHDVAGFAEQDWRSLAAPDAAAAIYMGKKAATFLRGRLLMHGAGRDVPVTAVENVSRTDQRVLSATIMTLPAVLDAAQPQGPVVLLLGIAARDAQSVINSENMTEAQ